MRVRVQIDSRSFLSTPKNVERESKINQKTFASFHILLNLGIANNSVSFLRIVSLEKFDHILLQVEIQSFAVSRVESFCQTSFRMKIYSRLFRVTRI